METRHSEEAYGIRGYYHEQESLGRVPALALFINGKEVEPINRVSITKSMASISYVRYPGKTSISFESRFGYKLGDKVQLRVYYDGQRWDKMHYYTLGSTPRTNIYNAVITKKEFNSAGINKGETYSYQCSSDLRGLGDKITIVNDSKMSDIVRKMAVANTYEGDDTYTVQTPGEYKVSKILSDLAEYASFNSDDNFISGRNFSGRNFITEIKNGVLVLVDTTNKVVEHVNGLTAIGAIKYREDAQDMIVSAHWGNGEYETKDEDEDDYSLKYDGAGNPSYDKKEVRRSNGKVTLLKENGEIRRNPKYYHTGMGEILEVLNVFVPYDKRGRFLEWKVLQETNKESFQMGTYFLSTPLGGKVNVEVIPPGEIDEYENGIGWFGYITGKKIKFSIGDKVNFSYSIDVQKAGDWVPRRFKWGNKWDTGEVWISGLPTQ